MQTLALAPKLRSRRAVDVLPNRRQGTNLYASYVYTLCQKHRWYQHSYVLGLDQVLCSCSPKYLLASARPSKSITDVNPSAGIRNTGGIDYGLVDLSRICQAPGLAHSRQISQTIVIVAFVPDAC